MLAYGRQECINVFLWAIVLTVCDIQAVKVILMVTHWTASTQDLFNLHKWIGIPRRRIQKK